MVNVRAIANRATSAINPNILASVRRCTGYLTTVGFHREPSYADPVDVVVQIQALTAKDLQHLDAMDIQGVECAAYSNVQLAAVDRKDQTGGDLVTFTNPATGTSDTWLVTAILENWATASWGRVGLTKQIDG